MTRKTVINLDYADLREWVESLPEIFDSQGDSIFRKRNEIKIFQPVHRGKPLRVAVKSFRRPTLAGRIIYTLFRSTKACRSYLYSLRYISLGIDSPEPIAYVETRRSGLIDRSYYVSLMSDSIPTFDAVVAADRYDPQLTEAIGHLIADMHSKGAVHGDPNLKNILYDPQSLSLSLIDNNRSRFGRVSPRDAVMNLRRITHRRDALRSITDTYARVRGLDAERLWIKVDRACSRFERNRRLRHAVKDTFRRLFNKKPR